MKLLITLILALAIVGTVIALVKLLMAAIGLVLSAAGLVALLSFAVKGLAG